jgi:hypothetical protein
MRRTFVCLRFPPRFDSRYTGKLFVPVRSTRYGFVGAGVEEGGDAGEAVVVEALAMPRKRVSVDGRGRPSGRRKGSDMEAKLVIDPACVLGICA